MQGSKLFAHAAQFNSELKAAIKKGYYRKISMSFYHPDSDKNPKPGIWYPRHVGFLGAVAPAVKGLSQVQFSQKLDNHDNVEFAMTLKGDEMNSSLENISNNSKQDSNTNRDLRKDFGKTPVRSLFQGFERWKIT